MNEEFIETLKIRLAKGEISQDEYTQLVSVVTSDGSATSPENVEHDEKTYAPGAKKALIQAIIGLFILAFIFGPLALINAKKAEQAIENDVTLKGKGMITAAKIIGWLDIILFILFIFLSYS